MPIEQMKAEAMEFAQKMIEMKNRLASFKEKYPNHRCFDDMMQHIKQTYRSDISSMQDVLRELVDKVLLAGDEKEYENLIMCIEDLEPIEDRTEVV